MRCIRFVGIFLGLAALVSIARPTLSDQWDKLTKITFSEPVLIPGTVLPAGTYTFKLADSKSDRHIVQVFDADHTKLITTVLAIPNYRLEPADKTVITYEERPADEPMALKAWFYPGDNFGQQFVYPRSEALRLSQLNKTEVPSTGTEEAYPGDHAEQPNAAQNVAPAQSQPQQPPVRAENRPAPNVQPTATPANPPVRSMPVAPPQSQHPPAELPHTASLMPLIGLIGLFLIAAASLIRVVVRR